MFPFIRLRAKCAILRGFIVLLVLKIEFSTTSCIIYTIYKNFMKSCAKYLTLILNVGKI